MRSSHRTRYITEGGIQQVAYTAPEDAYTPLAHPVGPVLVSLPHKGAHLRDERAQLLIQVGLHLIRDEARRDEKGHNQQSHLLARCIDAVDVRIFELLVNELPQDPD